MFMVLRPLLVDTNSNNVGGDIIDIPLHVYTSITLSVYIARVNAFSQV